MRLLFLLTWSWAFALLSSSLASAAIVEHSFEVKNLTVRRLCQEQVITAVNGSLPGPTIRVREGDILVVHVFNKSPYNMTIHWHGVFQKLSAWADGPEYVTQCPIAPGKSYTYKFKITGQEGTLWWHAHVSWLRATVYGALIIHPRKGHSYPFPKPYKEVPIFLGEYWNANVVDVINQAQVNGSIPAPSDAFTINGRPGDLYNCSRRNTYRLKVIPGNTYLLRIINAALNNQLFFKIAKHSFTVVAVDAEYTTPYVTDVVLLAPGHTTDVLFTANQVGGSYYMAAIPYLSVAGQVLTLPATTGIVVYEGANPTLPPLMPTMPAANDTATAYAFYSSLTSLVSGPHWLPVPLQIDEAMFITMGLALDLCPPKTVCGGPNGLRFSASMNNESFVLPSDKGLSMLEAFFSNVNGVYTSDFPNEPPVKYNYTDLSINNNPFLILAPRSTKVKRLKFNSTVEIVFQNTAFLGTENHPIHLHGFNFYVMAQGFGNYDPINDWKKFNFVNPQLRNTIAVPVGGWAVIRFVADNPGVWLVHCHLDVHMTWGLATAFVIENGHTHSSRLPPPPLDLPQCQFDDLSPTPM